MWWLDPGKELLQAIFNRVMAPYLENLDMNQVNYGISSGSLTLRNLRLKREALDKFRLPVDVVEGTLGRLQLNIPWRNFSTPMKAEIDDLFLLVNPAASSKYDPADDEKRAQAAKQERLRTAETLQIQEQAQVNEDSLKNQGFVDTILAKIINNFQVTVKNIHIRYEDSVSVPGHPFAAGITLSGFTIISVDGNWEKAFIPSTAGAIHKLAELHSFAVYFNTDSESIRGLPPQQSADKFRSLISTEENPVNEHQFILKPVSGKGKITMNNTISDRVPKFDVELDFEEISFLLDNHQYRDVISMVDMYHFFLRNQQYRKIRPTEEQITEMGRAKALWKFAREAVVGQVHEKHREWSWAHFAERRADRKRYVLLYKKKLPGALQGPDVKEFDDLEAKLSYEDLRFYRSIARAELRKDIQIRRKLEEEKKKEQQAKGGWLSWAWGSSSHASTDEILGVQMNDQRRKELFDALEYDEKAATAAAFDVPKTSLKTRVKARLQKGSLALRSGTTQSSVEIMSIVFQDVWAKAIQRPTSLDALVSLGDLHVYDSTTPNSQYPEIVKIKSDDTPTTSTVHLSSMDEDDNSNALLMVKFEQSPLDERADNGLTVRLRPMEVVYHRGFVEAIYAYFKPPETQMESVAALLDVASETLEGFRNATRAGLEHALQAHKTIDVQMDLQAPIIIVPEDVTHKSSVHLIVDAGHLAIGSELVPKKDVQEIYSKRNQQYTEEDYRRLEALMYDRFSVKLNAAQFVLGNGLDACLTALRAEEEHGLHLLEKTNMEFSLHNSIVPTAVQLSKIKVSGSLPELAVNFSNIKYKSLMRIVDAAIPKLGDTPASQQAQQRPPAVVGASKSQLPLSSNAFTGVKKQEYVVSEDHEDEQSTFSRDSATYYDAEDSKRLDLHQNQFELHFTVGKLKALLSKGNAAGDESPLAELVLESFGLDFELAKFDMQVGVTLGTLSMNYLEVGKQPVPFISCNDTLDQDLVKVKYTRVQPESPEFNTVYEGINQSVDGAFSTIVLQAQPEPVLAVYDFIMSTFVPEKPAVVQPSNGDTLIVLPEQPIPQRISGGSEQIRVNIQLQGVQVILVNSGSNIARLDLSKAAVSLLLQGNTLKIAGRLEDISITDEISPQPSDNQFKQILCREGDHFADFGYETFDPNDAENFTGVNSVVTLRTAALRLNFLEKPLHEVYIFLLKLARLKGLYDAATQAAAQSVSEITRMRFDVLVKSPIIVFPKDSSKSSDALVLRLGEISARNQYDGPKGTIEASLQGIGLTSQANLGDRISILKMIDDVLITATVVQTENVDHTAQPDVPDTKIIVNVSDIKLGLTQHQYCDLYLLSQAFTRVLASPPEAETSPAVQSAAPPSANLPQKGALNSKTSEQNAPVAPVDLVPEIALSPRQSIYPTLDLELKITTIKLQLFDDKALSEENLRSSGIARFALQDNSVRFKMYSNGGGEAEVILKSFTVTNTMPGPSKFREIIPPAKHDRNQFMVLFTMTGGKESSSLAIVTIESPKLLFTLDPLFALGNFFSSAFVSAPSSTPDAATVTAMTTKSKAAPESPPVREDSTLAFRIDLNDVSVTLLESDTDINSQAVQLSIRQLMMSQQGSLALNIMQLGMSLGQMGKPDESVRFMDDIDITLSMESKHTMALQRTSIDLSAKPIVFRASQQDINLILAIVTRATQLAAQSASDASQVDAATSKPSVSKTKSQAFATEKPQLIVSTEKLCASFDGFRLVLIGEGHEQPMMHLMTKPFQVNVQDWTGPMRVSTALAFDINYWNLTNSHWEPLLEPWTFVVEVNKDVATQAMRIQISSPHVLSANISMTFVELALAATSSWTSDNTRSLSRARGGTPPYRIKNETGSALEIWSNTEAGPGMSTLLQHDQVIDWRFDDWRSLREHVSSSGHNSIGIKFHGKEWDSIPSVTVDKEGQFPVILRPRIDGVLHRLLCDVVVEGNLKLVTLRSTYKIDNECLYPLEVILVDDHNKPAYALQKIDAKQSYSLPIEAVMRNRIKIRPDAGFGFGWSAESFKWEDLTKRPNHIVTCRSQDPANAPFRLSLWAERGGDRSRTYPKLNIKLYPPVELENLLPFDIRYRVHDKASGTSSTEFLRQGGIFPIHTVTLDHLVLLNIAIQDSGVWKPSNFMIINTNTSEFTRDKRLILPDVNGRQLELGLNYIPHGPGDSFKVQIYSPYIIINKTGLPFEIRSVAKMSMNAREVAGETRKDELAKTTPFMLSNTSGHEFVLKIGNSEWSETLDVEAPTAETDLVLPARNLEGHLGVSWTPGSGKYACSKVITLAPRFIVKNSTSAILRYREYGGAEQIDLQPGSTSPILWTRREPDKLLLIAYPGLNAIWSEPINMENIGSVHLRLQPNDQRTAPQLIKADIEVAGATLFVTLQRETKWPFRIENLSDHHFTMVQSNEAGVAKEKAPKYELVPRSAIDYAWDFPASSDKFLRLTINGFSRTVQITEIGSLLPFKFLLPERSSRTVALDIRADGSTQILSITNYNEERSVYKRARAPTGRQETLMSQEAFEAVQEDSTPSLTLFLILEGFGLSLINRSLVEVVHFSAKAFKLEYTMSDTSQSINLSIGDIQLDNQLPEATFQVVLQPSPLPSRRSAPPLPAVQTSIVLLNDKSHGVMFVKYASILLQSLTIMLDEDFLMEILDMTKIKGAWQGLDEDVLIREPNLIPEPDKSAPPGQEIYFEGLLLQPLRFIVSFVRAERTTQTTTISRNPIATVVHAFTMALGNINGAPLEFSALILSDARMSQSMLTDRIFRHYRQGVIQQLYKILGSIDFIGNPVGLFTNVSSGVMDIFYEPYDGVIMHGGEGLGTGIAKGAASFLKKTTFGLADTVTRVTSSFGKGLSSATFDSEYQSRRRLAQRRNNPRHVFAGVAAGGSAMLDSLSSAVQGVVVKPVEGLDREGGVGFAKGVAKGVAGLFVKPVVGVTDLFSITATGVRNTATMFDPPDRGRFRIPRHVPFDGVLKSYSSREAIGQQWLREVDDGHFKHHVYVAHIESEPNRQVCLLTSTAVICAWTNKLRLCWEASFSEVGTVSLEENGIRVLDRKREEIGFIIITEQADREWFYGEVSKVIGSHNAMKRLESS